MRKSIQKNVKSAHINYNKTLKKIKIKNFNNEYTRVRYDDFFQGSRILDKLLQCNQEVIKKKKIVQFLLQFAGCDQRKKKLWVNVKRVSLGP